MAIWMGRQISQTAGTNESPSASYTSEVLYNPALDIKKLKNNTNGKLVNYQEDSKTFLYNIFVCGIIAAVVSC
jgi:hypothetical protein